MPSNRLPNSSPVSQMPLTPETPKVKPMPNLGSNPKQVVVNKFRPKKKTPAGVPNPKPYNPFSQSMNTFG